MEKLEYSLPSLHNVSEGLKLWNLVKKSNATDVNIFFDSSSLIDMLMGVGSLYRGQVFQPQLYNKSFNLVYALAYRNWLGTLYLLPPHIEELLDSLQFNDRLFPRQLNADAQFQHTHLWNNLLNTNDLIKVKAILDNNDKGQISEPIITEIQRRPYHFFLGVYFSSHENDWKKRYKHLIKEKGIVQFVADADYNIDELNKSPLFKLLMHSLNKKRMTKTANNHIDAIALCILNERLKKKLSGNTSTLPLFFCNQEAIFEAVNSIPNDFTDADGKRPFMYSDQNNKESFSIIRDASFFIIEGFVRSMQENSEEKSLADFYSTLGRIVETGNRDNNDELERIKKEDLEPKVQETVMLEFFDHWWKDNGLQEILTALSLTEDPNQHNLEDQVASHIDQERKRLAKSIQGFGSRYFIIKKAWQALSRFSADIKHEFIEKSLRINAFDDFGPRVNFSDKVCKIIQDWVDRIIKTVEVNDEQERKTIESEVINDLISAMFEKIDHKGYDPEKLNQLAASIGFFFCFKKYELVAQVCTEVRKRHIQEFETIRDDKYPIHAIALVHAASLFQEDKTVPSATAEEEALEIIQCVESKATNNYKAWIGLAYLYILLWKYRMTDEYKFRELMSREDYENMQHSKGVTYLYKAIDYSRKVLDYLVPILNSDTQKYSVRSRKYFYALNIYVFLSTFYTNKEEFLKLKPFAEKLQGISAFPNLFQESRFSDTLARFYFRLAILSQNEEKYNHYLEKAKKFNERARENEPKRLYLDLMEQIVDWEKEKGGYAAALETCRIYEAAH